MKKPSLIQRLITHPWNIRTIIAKSTVAFAAILLYTQKLDAFSISGWLALATLFSILVNLMPIIIPQAPRQAPLIRHCIFWVTALFLIAWVSDFHQLNTVTTYLAFGLLAIGLNIHSPRSPTNQSATAQ